MSFSIPRPFAIVVFTHYQSLGEITEIKNALGPYDSVQAALDDCDEEIETRQK